jgi:transcriptional regulator with XRE-family HTH domain
VIARIRLSLDRIIMLRTERGVTQNELAAKIGVHVSQIRRFEGG